MPKNVGLICDYHELSSLFQKSQSIYDFFKAVVSTVAYHMEAAVCSIYLWDEDRRDLVLAATQGLSQEAVGRLRLKLGEGLVGTSLKLQRVMRAGRGVDNPHFKPIPGINEEQFEAFLAVPMLRKLQPVGVLVVQDPQPDYFSEKDGRALKMIGEQLVALIEETRMLLDLHKVEPPRVAGEQDDLQDIRIVKGNPICGGVVVGKALVIGEASYDVFTAGDDEPETPEHGLSRFRQAMTLTEHQLTALQKQLDEKLADVAALIFSAHLLMLRDPDFLGEMEKRILNGTSPNRAVTGVVNDFITLFSRSSNPRLREKVQDVKDLGHRLLQNLSESSEHESDYKGQIVISGELLPSDMLKLSAQRVEGVVMVQGGSTAHVAILARSLQLPIIFADEPRLLSLGDGTPLLLDATQGVLYVEPAEQILHDYEQVLTAIATGFEEEKKATADKTFTKDRARVRIYANVNLLSDLTIAIDFKAEGVGLYRSEFPFIVRSAFPTEEEQVAIYRRIAEGMGTKNVVLRTLDVGGDKMLPYHSHVHETNPFLGLRAIRFTLRNPGIFTQQIRAMLRAGHNHPLHIMFPFISSVDEFAEASALVRQCVKDLHNEGLACNAHPKLGCMVELPAAVEIIDELGHDCDFLSIGSNDLIQYLLAVDRTNERVSSLYVPYHPAVLRALKRIAEGAARQQVDLSLCGDMALDARMLPFLLGVGIRKLSVDPRSIFRLQKKIQAIDSREAETIAGEMLAIGRLAEMEDYLRAHGLMAGKKS
ncbi:MAG: phosphoenolpyruvate--protein phosphotransferase [Kiritimatiellia bacterium]